MDVLFAFLQKIDPHTHLRASVSVDLQGGHARHVLGGSQEVGDPDYFHDYSTRCKVGRRVSFSFVRKASSF